MKAHVLESIGDLRYEDIDCPVLESNEVLVNIKACGICGSDINRVFKTGTYHFPTVIGHEFSGVVVKTSESNSQWQGKRVGVFPLKPCFECSQCKAGNYEMCLNYDYLGSRCNGGFEEFVAVPEWNLIELPDNVSFEEAAMLEPISVAIHALGHAGDITGKNVAVIGPGPIGNLIVKIAKLRGAKKVIMIGRTVEKLDFSMSIGVDLAINSKTQNIIKILEKATDGHGADIVIEGTGSSKSLSTCIEIASRGGRIILMGNPLEDEVIPKNTYWQILRRQLTLTGTWNSSFGRNDDDWHEAVELLSSGKLNVKPLITHRLQFHELLGGLQIMRDDKIFSQKVILVNDRINSFH